MDDPNTFTDIAAYLAGELPEAEQATFAARLAQDDVLAARVAEQRLTHQAVDRYAQLRSKEQVRAIYQNGTRARRLPGRT